MTPHAPQVPASWHAPAWVTPQSIALIVAGVVVLLVILRLTRILGHLAKAVTKAAAPAAAPAARSSGRVPVRLLALLAAAVGGFALFEHVKTAATAVKAAPGPSPSPTPRPTITQTVAPHVTAFHFPLTGGQILIGLGIAAVVAIILLGPVLRRGDS